MKTVKRTEL